MRPILLLAALSIAAPALAAPSADEAAVREVVRKYTEAREARSPEAIGALFTDDADQHTTAGAWRRGRAEILRGTAQASAQTPGVRRITVQTVRFVTSDTAIVDGPYEVVEGGKVTRSMWATLVVVRGPGGWRIAAIRNAIPAKE
jgi:uncharacterized protein (TIGR02246 family)